MHRESALKQIYQSDEVLKFRKKRQEARKEGGQQTD